MLVKWVQTISWIFPAFIPLDSTIHSILLSTLSSRSLKMEVGAASNNDSTPQPQIGPQRQKKKRVRHWTAEDRAVHREFEKSRREAFSERLLVRGEPNIISVRNANCFKELTKLLPTLEEDTRPSKHIIVDASISYHRAQQARCQKATSTIQALLAERDDLIREVNSLRSLYSPGASVPRQALPIDSALLDFLNGSDVPDSDPSQSSGVHKPAEVEIDKPYYGSLEAPFIPPTTGGPPRVASYANPPINTPLPFPPAGWESNTGDKGLTVIPQSVEDTSAYQWHSPSGSNSSQAKSLDLRYNTTSHLVNDSASFWTHHPGILAATPPQDTDLQYAIDPPGFANDPSFLWPLDIGIHTTTLAENAHSIPSASSQNFQVSNQLLPNSESLSI